MKKLFAVALLLTATLSFAQDKKEKRQQLTGEQRAELQVKKMTLDLDLNEKQQKEMKVLVLEQHRNLEAKRAARKNKHEKGEISSDDKFEMRKALLDEQIAFKEKVKEVLTPEQFAKWDAKRDSRKEHMKARTLKAHDREKSIREKK